ncbi:MAG: tetratricopeptide repeat protein [Pseudomonadota bacterium]|nr:MAG: tetratricopeptide repeat protein [Pseudomonadota bacterium]
MQAHRHARAHAVFTRISTGDPDNAAARFWLARALFAQCRFEEAAVEYQRAAALDAANADYHFRLGEAWGELAQRAGVFRKASYARKTREAMERAVALDPAHVDAGVALTTFYLRAPGFMGGGLDKAEAAVRTLLAANALRGEVQQARIVEARGNTAQAEQAFQRLLRDYAVPDDVRFAHLQYGHFLLRQRAHAAAISQYQQALALGTDAAAYIALGDGYRDNGDGVAAARAYRRAEELENSCVAAERLEALGSS